MNSFRISWQAPEFEYRAKTAAWYWVTVGIAVLMLGAAVWQRNFLFVVFIITAEMLMLVWSSRMPRTIDLTLEESGLTIDGRTFYSINDFTTWSIDTTGTSPHATAAFHFHRRLRLPLHIKIPREQAEEVAAHLGTVVEQAPWEESIIDALEKFFGF